MSEEARTYSPVKAALVGFAGWALIGCLGATWRLRVVGDPCPHGDARPINLLYAFWHGHLLSLVYHRRREGIRVLVSQGRDGEYITRVIHHHGFRTVRGSSSRGGFRSLLEMVSFAREGGLLAITPDGPRGPRHRVQPGVLLVAQRGRIPIVPLAVTAWPRKNLRSWDRFLVPLPFARIVVAYGAPLNIEDEGSPEEIAAQWTQPLERALLAAGEAAEAELRAWTGKPALPPAPSSQEAQARAEAQQPGHEAAPGEQASAPPRPESARSTGDSRS